MESDATYCPQQFGMITPVSDAFAIEVRPAVPEDLEGLQHVANLTWRQTYAGLIPDTDISAFLEQAYSLKRLEAALDVLGDGLIVASQQSQLIGYAQAGVNSNGKAELFAIYVLPEFHGAGTGLRLWQQATSHFANLGFETFIVWVLDGNQQARQFYERQGAVAVEERPFTVGNITVSEIGYLSKTGSS